MFPKYILSVSPKQCVHALYPLFDCPKLGKGDLIGGVGSTVGGVGEWIQV